MNHLLQAIRAVRAIILTCQIERHDGPCGAQIRLPVGRMGERGIICPGCGTELPMQTARQFLERFRAAQDALEALANLRLQPFGIESEPEQQP